MEDAIFEIRGLVDWAELILPQVSRDSAHKKVENIEKIEVNKYKKLYSTNRYSLIKVETICLPVFRG